MARFARDEAHRLRALGDRPAFGVLGELSRVVGNDCARNSRSFTSACRPCALA